VQSDPIGLAGGNNTYRYGANNPAQSFDPYGLYCVSANGFTTCRFPGGPAVRLPTPSGFPKYLGPEEFLYHNYDVAADLGGADANCVFQKMVNNPTPGKPGPATKEGTRNNAEVGGRDNWVMSYLTTDLNTGAPVMINIADSGSLFRYGYVMRTVRDGAVHTYGEGNSWKQSERVTGWEFQSAGNGTIWGDQMKRFVQECLCGK
jgi:uncharacterized protein RhaS with RHS repeats